jgi:hypothetical protein
MSHSTLPDSRTGDETGSAATTLSHSVLKPAKGIAFWSAVALPFLYIPMLATGLDGTASILTFTALLLANAVALLLGHPHGRD